MRLLGVLLLFLSAPLGISSPARSDACEGQIVAEPSGPSITNGDFECGDFTGWTLFTTPGGSSSAAVVPNDFPDGGAFIARFALIGVDGDASPPLPTAGGGGIFQSVVLPAGDWLIEADISALIGDIGAQQGEAGTFELIFDDEVVKVVSFAAGRNNPFHGSLTASVLGISGGAHDIRIRLLGERIYFSLPAGPCPDCGEFDIGGRFVDNVTVPEPSEALLRTVALLLIGGVGRRATRPGTT